MVRPHFLVCAAITAVSSVWLAQHTVTPRAVPGFHLPAAGAFARQIGTASESAVQHPPALDHLLPSSSEPIYTALDARFDAAAAMETVVFMDRFWRVPANAGFLRSQDHIRDRLVGAGFTAVTRSDAGGIRSDRVWYEEFADKDSHGWDHTRGTLSILGEGGAEEEVLSRERHRLALCVNSFPTPGEGLTAPLLDVGDGRGRAAYDGRSLKGAVVLGNAPVEVLWEEAVRKRGASGVISTALPDYITRPAPGGSPDDALDVLQWDSIPYDEQRASFAFKATPRAAARLRERLRAGAVRVRVQIDATFNPAPNRTLIAEIPGATRPDERIVMVAHVQEPGANDDGSGCGTLQALATALVSAIRDGTIARPARTLTFLWVDEIRGSRQWLEDHPREAGGVRFMFSLDMTGEDTAKTGGTFLLEKQPDPSAAWLRPSDPQTEWGSEEVDPRSLKGSLLNDVYLAVCQRRARDTGWIVRTNPYAGGSDHEVFVEAGVPAVLSWHFTDRYYHTNLDRPDKTSPVEMKHVGVTVGTTAILLASATVTTATSLAGLVAEAAEARLLLERRQSAAIIAESPADETRTRETRIINAWRQWYREALASVLTLPIEGTNGALRNEVARRAARLDRL